MTLSWSFCDHSSWLRTINECIDVARKEKADQLGALAKMEKDAMAAATYDEKHLLIDG